MNKRESILAIVNALLDIEDTSGKKVFFNYSGHVSVLSFHICPSINNYSEYLGGRDQAVYYKGPDHQERISDYTGTAMSFIKMISEIDEKLIDDVVDVKIKRSKAIELGLIKEDV